MLSRKVRAGKGKAFRQSLFRIPCVQCLQLPCVYLRFYWQKCYSYQKQYWQNLQNCPGEGKLQPPGKEEPVGPVAVTWHRAVHAELPLLPTPLCALHGTVCWNSARFRAQDHLLGLHYQTIFLHSAKTRKASNFISKDDWVCKHLQSKTQSVSESAEKGWRGERKEKVMINVHLTRSFLSVQDELCYG